MKLNYSYLLKLSNNIPSPITIITTYLLGFQYKNSRLEFFPHAEGYVKYDQGDYSYVFNYTDHLGNIRLSYTYINNSNIIDTDEIVEENQYYPFGLKHETHNTSNAYQYKYNGKELQTELGLNLYDYGARNYDAALGRWMNIDLLAELYYPVSPYVYGLNNPMFFVDPDGKKIIIYYGQDGDRQEEYKYKKDRDYSEIKDSFLADSYRALDALHSASNVEIDGKQVNILDELIKDSKELSLVQTENGSSFAYGRDYESKGNWKDGSSNVIGTIHFNNKEGVLFDDVNDTSGRELEKMYANGTLPKTAKINSPTSVLGHEVGHAFNYNDNSGSYFDRRDSAPVHFGKIRIKNQEEAKATTLSTQINIKLNENPRLNHRAGGVITQGVLSNKPKK